MNFKVVPGTDGKFVLLWADGAFSIGGFESRHAAQTFAAGMIERFIDKQLAKQSAEKLQSAWLASPVKCDSCGVKQ